jgi:DNA-binding CsgD family transcriptional regulator
MAKIEDFFISTNSVLDIPEEEYQKINTLIATFDAVSRVIYQCLYIIDYNKQNFLYVSSNPLFLCGHNTQEILEMGYAFYLTHVPEQEQIMLTEINYAGFKFFEKLPVEEKIKSTISYDFHIINGKKKTLINHKLTPVLLTDDGKIWLAACIISLSSHSKPGNIVLHIADQPFFYEYSLINHHWKENKGITLNEREKDVLSLSAQGYSMNEIADRLFVTFDTIKFYRRRILEKLQVKNITEALSFATSYRLL